MFSSGELYKYYSNKLNKALLVVALVIVASFTLGAWLF